MQASVGDRIIIRGHHVGEPDRDCEVIEVRGPTAAGPTRFDGRTPAMRCSSSPAPTPLSNTSSMPKRPDQPNRRSAERTP